MSRSSYKPNLLFWIIGILGLAWNAMGVKAYIDQAYQTEAYLANTPKAMLEIASNAPGWTKAVFAIAVFVSVIACIALLLRKRIARFLFLIGLLAILVQTFTSTTTAGMFEAMDTFNRIMFVMIPIVAFFLYFYSKSAANKGWLTV